MDPEGDLLERYDRMVQTQIELLEGIDQKAAIVMRIVSLLLGILLAGAALLIDIDRTLSGSTIGTKWVLLGLLFLLISLLYAVITSVSSDVLHGPHEGLGKFFADYELEEMDYALHLLAGYSRAIRYNRRVMHRNAVRLGRSLQALLYGMVSLSAGILLLFVSLPLISEFVVSALTVLGALSAGSVLTRETYLGSRGDHEV